MGNVQASVTKQTLQSYTEVINEVISDTYNEAIAKCNSQNILDVKTCPDFIIEKGGNVKFRQTAISQCEQFADISNEVNENFQTVVENTTESFIENDLKNEQGFFATAFSLQEARNITVQDMSTEITNSFDESVTNICRAEANSFNQGEVELCGIVRGNYDFSQDALTYALSNCVIRNIRNTITGNQVLNDIFAKTDAKLASKQEGLGSILRWLIIGGIVLGVILIIGLIIYFIISSRSSGGGGGGVNINVTPGSMQSKK
jgi:hypothetical protein